MAKAGTVIKDAQGQEWHATEGGHWRLYENGKATSKLFSGKGDPVAGPAAGAPGPAASAPGALNPTTAIGANGGQLPPELQNVQKNLQAQVEQEQRQPGTGINQSQANFELQRQTQLYQQTHPSVGTNTPLETPSDVLNATSAVSADAQKQGNLLTNANQNNPFGNSTTSIDPVTGQPIVNQTLSQGNQNVVNSTQGTAVKASDALGGLVGPGGQVQNFINNAGPSNGPSQSLIDAYYGHLTQGFAADKQQEYEDKSQELANRGIPVGSDAYKNEMNRLDLKWQNKEGDARNQAVSNSYTQSTNNQVANTGSLNALSGALSPLTAIQSSGYFNPNFQQFNAVNYQQPDVGALYNTLTSKNIADANNKNAIDVANISANASMANAATAAGASEHNAELAAQASHKPQTTPSPFQGGRPPGS